MTRWIDRKLSVRAQCVLAGAALGAAAFLLLYGFTPLNFFSDTWVRGGYVERDVVQHYTGWLFYRDSPWSFPLGIAQNMNWPNGGYVGFTDSIPLFAVFFKLFAPLLPATFQYFGLWGFICSILQGASAALLLSLFTDSRLRCALLSLLFILAPIFLDRQLRHGALGAQWLILFALYLYFKHRRSGRFFSPGFLVLGALSITIHPYFVPMVLAILFALLLENALRHKKWWQPLAMLAGCLAAVLAVGWVFGAFSSGAGDGGTPYGYFSMNLNAVFNPAGHWNKWSLLLPELEQTFGNYDGFNYLGLGLLLAWLVMFIEWVLKLRQSKLGGLVKAHWGLLAVCLCLLLFAVSNQVTLQGRELFTLPLPTTLTRLASMLRSSGRMFYPVWYVLALAPCVYLLRKPPIKWRSAACAGLVVVQLADLSPALAYKAQSFRPYEPVIEQTMQSGFWQTVQGRYTHMASLDVEGVVHGIEAALYAATNGMTTDDPFSARHDAVMRAAQVDAHLEALESGSPASGTLYITSTEAVFLEYAEALEASCFCALVDDTWFVIAPYGDGFDAYTDDDALPIADYPLRIADYSDALWEQGVLAADRRVVCFEDSAFARKRLDGMSALEANGVAYPILEVSYRDAGWILVTLDVQDAGVLAGTELESIP